MSKQVIKKNNLVSRVIKTAKLPSSIRITMQVLMWGAVSYSSDYVMPVEAKELGPAPTLLSECQKRLGARFVSQSIVIHNPPTTGSQKSTGPVHKNQPTAAEPTSVNWSALQKAFQQRFPEEKKRIKTSFANARKFFEVAGFQVVGPDAENCAAYFRKPAAMNALGLYESVGGAKNLSEAAQQLVARHQQQKALKASEQLVARDTLCTITEGSPTAHCGVIGVDFASAIGCR